MGASELSRSVLEGVAYSVRLLIEVLESSSGVSATRLRHVAGAVGSAVWCQIRADVLDRSIDRVENLDFGVGGAAILAGTAAGVFASIEDATAHMVRPERTFEPNRALKGHYEEGLAGTLTSMQDLRASAAAIKCDAATCAEKNDAPRAERSIPWGTS